MDPGNINKRRHTSGYTLVTRLNPEDDQGLYLPLDGENRKVKKYLSEEISNISAKGNHTFVSFFNIEAISRGGCGLNCASSHKFIC